MCSRLDTTSVYDGGENPFAYFQGDGDSLPKSEYTSTFLSKEDASVIDELLDNIEMANNPCSTCKPISIGIAVESREDETLDDYLSGLLPE